MYPRCVVVASRCVKKDDLKIFPNAQRTLYRQKMPKGRQILVFVMFAEKVVAELTKRIESDSSHHETRLRMMLLSTFAP